MNQFMSYYRFMTIILNLSQFYMRKLVTIINHDTVRFNQLSKNINTNLQFGSQNVDVYKIFLKKVGKQ